MVGQPTAGTSVVVAIPYIVIVFSGCAGSYMRALAAPTGPAPFTLNYFTMGKLELLHPLVQLLSRPGARLPRLVAHPIHFLLAII